MGSAEFILVISAFLTSTLSGVVGMGGGILLLTIMGQFFAPTVLIPIHGLVQLASNSSRAYLSRESINWPMTRHFCLGALIGAGLGRLVVVEIPSTIYTLVLAVFILTVTWMPTTKLKIPGFSYKFIPLGVVAAFCSLFIGATGPLLAPFFLREKLGKESVVATKAIFQAVVHTLKIFVFVSLGFIFNQYAVLLSMMIVAVFCGSWCGKFFLGRVPEKAFQVVFKTLITVLALRMLFGLVGE